MKKIFLIKKSNSMLFWFVTFSFVVFFSVFIASSINKAYAKTETTNSNSKVSDMGSNDRGMGGASNSTSGSHTGTTGTTGTAGTYDKDVGHETPLLAPTAPPIPTAPVNPTVSPSESNRMNRMNRMNTDHSTGNGYMNEDRNKENITADTQRKGSDSDVQLTREIRQKLTSDDNLSTAAKNIKIITLRNSITLKGNLKSQEEIDKVVSIAKELAGNKTVKNQIRIKK
ncbi:MAG: BON domain-containing protein [Oligoflexia bacterium]|nr:BON domain-containing protein [Oligoflexia bacterium]